MLMSSRLPPSSVLSNCESELQELMRQIDLMLHCKKADWERERQQLRARLDVRDQEYIIQKSTLDAKNTEVLVGVSFLGYEVHEQKVEYRFGLCFLSLVSFPVSLQNPLCCIDYVVILSTERFTGLAIFKLY